MANLSGSATFGGSGGLAARADARGSTLAGAGALSAFASTIITTFVSSKTRALGQLLATGGMPLYANASVDANGGLFADAMVSGRSATPLIGDATIRTIDDLLYLFRDNQAPKSITSSAFRDMTVSMHCLTATFQDLPTSAAGLPAGRIYLNGDVLQISGGTVPGAKSGSFSAAAVGTISAAGRVRLSARALLSGSGGITATASGPAVFDQSFSLPSQTDIFVDAYGSGPFPSAFNQSFDRGIGPTTGTWYPSRNYAPDNAGYVIGNTWILNPFNPATPIAGSYGVSGGNLRLLMQNTPAPYLAACGGKPYIGTQLVAVDVATFGRFEARLSAPAINGTECAFYLISNSGGATPVTTEIDIIEIVTSSSWSPRSQWSTSIKPPGYPPGVGNVAEYYSYNPGAPLIDVTQMNVYAAEVRPTYISVSVNGVEVLRAPPPTEFGNNPWCIYLGQGDGGSWTGPLDTNPVYTPMIVDYVRVMG